MNTDKEKVAKWATMEKVNVLLTEEQKEGLDKLAKKIMKHRRDVLIWHDDEERITANTILRALIDNFLRVVGTLPLRALATESDVKEWVKQLFKEVEDDEV